MSIQPATPIHSSHEVGDSLIASLRGQAARRELDLPLPARGRTIDRWWALARWGGVDLSAARLVEGHADAVAILAEMGVPRPRGLLGVWAAHDPRAVLQASRRSRGWHLHGEKRWCSGAHLLDAALVTADASDGRRLFVVDLAVDGVTPLAGTWNAVGMAGSDSGDVQFDLVIDDAAAVGAPDAYGNRPGFWHGGCGVAAVWYGGAEAVVAPLLAKARSSDDPHVLAHLGAVDATVTTMRTVLERAAADIDEDPLDRSGCAERRARTVRHVVEVGASDIVERVGKATGADPLCHDAEHARRVADLLTYLRQSHAERDLAMLGRIAASG